jgi:sec-independent protein translocase protein TatA
MPNIGWQELLLVLVVALVIFGPKRLPELGRSLGKGIREFKKATTEIQDHFDVDLDDKNAKPATRPAAVTESRPAAEAAEVVTGEVLHEETDKTAGSATA